MIIWLPSYPRSGNTLVRLILHRSFGLETHSKYNDVADIGADKKISAEVGHQRYEGRWANAYSRFTKAKRLYIVKTHEGPEDAAPAIVVVRHGWPAVVSNQNYLRDFAGIEASLAEVISGQVGGFPSWGHILDLWDPERRPKTLLLKYEDLVATPEQEIAKIAAFIGIEKTADWKNNFDELQRLDPRFFRRGNAAAPTKDQLGSVDAHLFEQIHGDWMVRLGYSKPSAVVDRETCRLLRQAVEEGSARRDRDRQIAAARTDVEKLKSQLDQLASTTRQQTEYIAILEKERDRLTTEAHQFHRDQDRLLGESQGHIETLKIQLDQLAATAQQQAEFIAILARERDRLTTEAHQFRRDQDGLLAESHKDVATLQAQLDQLAATSRQQAEYIAVLEKERGRLADEARQSGHDQDRLFSESQGHTVTLKTQLDQLAAISREQAEYIAVLEKERDRLAALAKTLTESSEHYTKVINEQESYIKILEAQRSTIQSPPR